VKTKTNFNNFWYTDILKKLYTGKNIMYPSHLQNVAAPPWGVQKSDFSAIFDINFD